MQELLTSISTYGYIFLFLYSIGGGFFAIVAAGALSYAGKMDITTSIIVAAIANYIGDMLLFYLARYNKKPLLPYMRKHRRKFALSHILIKKYGSFIIFIQKFIYGVKTLVPIAIGLTKYSFFKFGVLNVFASIIWALFFGILSYKGGEYIINFFSKLKDNPWIAPLILLSVLTIAWIYFNKVTKK